MKVISVVEKISDPPRVKVKHWEDTPEGKEKALKYFTSKVKADCWKDEAKKKLPKALKNKYYQGRWGHCQIFITRVNQISS
jgi:hypothetical protein